MKHAHGMAALGIILALIIGVVLLNAVQAQTSGSVSTETVEYLHLLVNYPVIQELSSKSVPVFKAGENIKEALAVTSVAGGGFGFMALSEGQERGLYFIASDGDIGEIVVYKYDAIPRRFRQMDCGWWYGDRETPDIRPYLASTVITTDGFIFTEYNCEMSGGGPVIPSADAVVGAQTLAAQIQSKYAGKNVFVTPSEKTFSAPTVGSETKPITASNSESATITTCTIGNTTVRYNSLDRIPIPGGQFNMNATSNQPNSISGDPLAIGNADERLPISIFFKDGELSKYMLNIESYAWDGKALTLQSRLCINDGTGNWKAVWPKVSYAAYNGSTKKFVPTVLSAPVGLPLNASVENRDNLPEISALFSGGPNSNVTVYFYLNGTSQTIHALALNAQKDVEKKNYRFDLDLATLKAISELTEYKEKTPDDIRTMLLEKMTIKGIKGMSETYVKSTATTTTPATKAITLIQREGILNSDRTNDNKYWIVPNLMTSGEYEFTIFIDGHRSVKIPVTINTRDLSAQDPNRIVQDDVKTISIAPDQIRKDRCTTANDLTSALLCADTAFVDAFTTAK